jgi:RimJ/RimL family protein N-acetyltransferase
MRIIRLCEKEKTLWAYPRKFYAYQKRGFEMNRIIYTSDNILSLVEYQKCDDRALYDDWLDPDTQKGYNFVLVESFEDFSKRETKQRFFAMIRLVKTSEIIGAIGISPPDTIPDLAIMIFKHYRRQGYGTQAFLLATKYAAGELNINELHAGVYPDNIGSRKMIERCGYIPYPAGNVAEKHYLTGEEITQLDYIYRPITIRLATPADAMDMAEIHARSWEAAYKYIIPMEYIKEKNATRPALYQRIITDENTTQYVIQADEKTVGIMWAAPPKTEDIEILNDTGTDDSFYELHVIYLHPVYYRQRIGSQAMEFALDKARKAGKQATLRFRIFTLN